MATQTKTRREAIFPHTLGLGMTASEVGDLFDRFFDVPRNGSSHDGWTPPVSVWEEDNGFHLEAELPGVEEEHLNVTMNAGSLVIHAKREENKEGRRYLHNERRWGEAKRTIELPDYVDSDSIEATFVDGVLHVHLNKRPDVLPRKVEIKRGQ